MGLWDRMKGIRNIAKKIDWIYIPYKNCKIAIITAKKNKALKKDGIVIMENVNKTLAKTGFIFFVDYGTLLGAVREHDFISWDFDIDYGLVVKNADQWEEFQRIMEEAGFKKVRQFGFNGVITEQTYRKKNVTVDFFAHFHEGAKDATYLYSAPRNPENAGNENIYAVQKITSVRVSSVRKCQFRQIEVAVPENAEECLADIYGPTWKIPDASWSDDNSPSVQYLGDLGYAQFYKGNY